MSDFDFDELDKAVAGVTNPDAESTNTTTTDSIASVASVPIAPTAPNTQPLNDAEPVPEVEVPQRPRVVPAARRSSGRFMDVVHPSSDMRTRTTPAVLDTMSSKVETVAFVPPAPVPTTASAADTTVDAPSVTADVPYEAPKLNLIDDDDDDDKVFDLSDIENSTVGEWSNQLESPFLADTKVEKRPLGGATPELGQILLDAPEEELLLEAQTLPDPIDFAAHLEALSTEKEDTGTPEPIDETEAEEQTIAQLDELKEPEASVPPVLQVSTPEEPVGPTSITQQYTEQTVSQQESGAIFDTENYHQPLTPTPKKRSGVWTVVGILLLVILGAGAGVAFYLFVLPML